MYLCTILRDTSPPLTKKNSCICFVPSPRQKWDPVYLVICFLPPPKGPKLPTTQPCFQKKCFLLNCKYFDLRLKTDNDYFRNSTSLQNIYKLLKLMEIMLRIHKSRYSIFHSLKVSVKCSLLYLSLSSSKRKKVFIRVIHIPQINCILFSGPLIYWILMTDTQRGWLKMKAKSFYIRYRPGGR